jgi:hypothetical protein
MPRYWTLAEARAVLPQAVRLLQELQASVRELATAGRQPEAAPALRTPSVNGHGRATTPLPAEQRVRNLAAWFEQQGIQIKDLEVGLIDFPALRGDEEVLLCYRLGEPDLGFWHSLEGGFAGRRPIDEL